MLSIVDTFKEALFIGMRKFWPILILTLITEPPDVLIRQLQFDYSASTSSGSTLIKFILSISLQGLDIVNLAALLGLLKKGPDGSAWGAAWRGVLAYTVSLIYITLLIGVVCMTLGLIWAGILYILGLMKIPGLLMFGLYLIFMTCSLSLPVIVLEKLNAFNALKRAWAMARRHILYILSCFLVPGASALVSTDGP